MVMIERGGIRIREREDVCDIDKVAEQQFALLLLDKYSHVFEEIVYEGYEFVLPNANGEELRTRPDILVRNRRTGIPFVFEHTIASKNDIKGNDPTKQNKNKKHNPTNEFKGKQRMIVEAEGYRYIPYYRENLLRLQKKHPEYDLLGHTAKKMRRESDK